MEEIYNQLIKCLSKDRVLRNEPMCKHTSFKIGGPADIFVAVNTIEELKNTLNIAQTNKILVTCIGNGTNLLVKDKGIRGITIKLNFKNIKINGEEIEVGSGMQLPILAKTAYENSLSGLEFASGIPGTVGGAVKMNAGAYGGEFKDIVIETTYLDSEQNLKNIQNKEHKFSYRYSIFDETNDIIISTKLKLKKENQEIIKRKMEENSLKRKEKQPINFPNAGSVFKRKNEYIPAEIIDKCGLKGYNIGNAYVSKLHAGFIINKGNATAQDVLNLIEHIKNVVKEKYYINLELEIKVIGE